MVVEGAGDCSGTFLLWMAALLHGPKPLRHMEFEAELLLEPGRSWCIMAGGGQECLNVSHALSATG